VDRGIVGNVKKSDLGSGLLGFVWRTKRRTSSRDDPKKSVGGCDIRVEYFQQLVMLDRMMETSSEEGGKEREGKPALGRE
jgi:hypothetical protein